MASTSESGHAKNVASFQNLIICVTDYGTRYAPNKMALQLPQLETVLVKAQQVLSNVITKRTEYNIKVNERQITFSGLKKLATRLISSLQTTEANSHLIEDAKSYNRKIQGQRAKTKVKIDQEVGVTLPTQNSVSQQSYIQQVQHFEGLLSILNREPSYNPSEATLQLPNLMTLKDDLANTTNQVMRAESQWTDARILRDNVLYNDINALVNIATAVKLEIKSIFGSSSIEYAKIRKIPFKNLGTA